LHIPYKGSAPATNDLLAGVFHAQFDNMVTLIPHMKSGKLRPLAVSSAQARGRSAGRAHHGRGRTARLRDRHLVRRGGAGGDAGPIVDKLNREINRILALPDVAEKLNGWACRPRPMTPSQASATSSRARSPPTRDHQGGQHQARLTVETRCPAGFRRAADSGGQRTQAGNAVTRLRPADFDAYSALSARSTSTRASSPGR
jgi:hypothetical protein